MKDTILIFLILTAFTGCKNDTSKNDEKTITPKTSVEVVHVKKGAITDNLELLASTVYLKRNIAIAPIPAFITKVNIRLGDEVRKGQILYELESKERRALGNKSTILDSSMVNFGIIQVKAQASGIVSTLDKQQTGDYVLEGTQLCTIAESSDLAFQINVPFEYKSYVHQGEECKVILPDNTTHTAIITTPLSAMNMTAQTQTILAKSVRQLFLPENLTVKVLVNKGSSTPQQIVPKAAVQSDEMMESFWVMKLMNDSIAVKVPVDIGNQNQEQVEIISPEFKESDRIITTGAYNMPDTALVKVVDLN